MDSNEKYFLKFVQNLGPGDHICCIYESEEDHKRVFTSFVKEGLKKKEKVFYVIEHNSKEYIKGYFLDEPVERYIENGQFSILTSDEVYLRDGFFDPERMVSLLRSETEKALKEGYSALRVTGEMTWVLRKLPGSQRLIEYEIILNKFFPGSKCSAICQYDKKRFPPHLLKDILRTHPLAFIGTEFYHNFYYLPPEDMLSEDREKKELDKWIENLAENKKKEEDLIGEIDFAEGLILTVQTVIVVFDRDGKILRFNPYLEELTGYKFNEVKGRDWFTTFIPEKDHEKMREIFKKSISDIQTRGGVNPIVCKNGEWKYIEWYDKTLKDKSGNVKGLISAGTDVTERLEAEKKIKHLNSVLLAIRDVNQLIAKERNRDSLLEKSCDILTSTRGYYSAFIAIFDEEGRFLKLFQSSVGNEFLQLKEKIKSGEKLSCIQKAFEKSGAILIEDPEQDCKCPFSKVYSDRGAICTRLEFEEKIYGVFSISLKKHYINNFEEIALFEELARDLSFALYSIDQEEEKIIAQRELKEYSQRLEEMVEERTRKLIDAQEELIRKERLALLGQLAGGVGHELRHPLTVLSNASYYLSAVIPESDVKVREYVHLISEETKKANNIISDLLDYSRIKTPEREEMHIIPLIEKVLTVSEISADIEIVKEIPSSLPPLFIDIQKISQVFLNLISNACQAMGDRGVLVIKVKEINGFLAISFSDTGKGIPQENIRKVFEPLFTTKTKGIGLGLAICKNFVEINEGKIEVESIEGKGSKFTVTLPVKRCHND